MFTALENQTRKILNANILMRCNWHTIKFTLKDYSSIIFNIFTRLRNQMLLLSHLSRVQLCDPIDGSPPGSSIPGILQARTLEWIAISFSNVWKWKVKVKSLSRVQLFATPRTAAYQAPLSMGFSRQEYWSGLPLPATVSNSRTFSSLPNETLNSLASLIIPSPPSHWQPLIFLSL